MKAAVLNGEVSEGDRVAYATRVGNIAAIHLGTVVGVAERKEWDKVVPVIKVQVETESGGWPRAGIIRTVGNLDRVVKL